MGAEDHICRTGQDHGEIRHGEGGQERLLRRREECRKKRESKNLKMEY
jgi:hypothetical protein